MPDMQAEIQRRVARIEALEQARDIAIKEQTGRADQFRTQIEALRREIAALDTINEVPTSAPRFIPCAKCGKPIWPESAPTCDACTPSSTRTR